MGPDDTICYCYHVPLRKLWSYARRTRPARASQLSECLGAGTGCGWCIPILKRIHAELRQRDAATDAGTPADTDVAQLDVGMTSEEYVAQRDAYRKGGGPKNQF